MWSSTHPCGSLLASDHKRIVMYCRQPLEFVTLHFKPQIIRFSQLWNMSYIHKTIYIKYLNLFLTTLFAQQRGLRRLM